MYFHGFMDNKAIIINGCITYIFKDFCIVIVNFKFSVMICLTLWQADCFNQADCHGQINLIKKFKKDYFLKTF